MSAALPFDLVDVFAKARYQGNQLAVFHDAGGLSTETMQAMALETNFSETTFVTGGDAESGYDVRIFTPTYELPFAGHPTLGTAAAVRARHDVGAGEVTLNLAVGQVPVRFDDDLCWLTSPPTTTVRAVDGAAVARSLGLSPDSIDGDFPTELVSSGPDFVMVPMASLDALEAAALDLAAFEPLAAQDIPAHVYGFSRGSRVGGHGATVRLFFNANGVREDPATGSAACCLGHYAREHRYLGELPVGTTLSQGTQCRRPSVLHLSATGDATFVGGNVVFVASGNWPA